MEHLNIRHSVQKDRLVSRVVQITEAQAETIINIL